jgi:hypothetical protein
MNRPERPFLERLGSDHLPTISMAMPPSTNIARFLSFETDFVGFQPRFSRHRHNAQRIILLRRKKSVPEVPPASSYSTEEGQSFEKPFLSMGRFPTRILRK